MEAVRQTIDSSLLDGVVQLPKDFENKEVEIIVFLKENLKKEKKTPHLLKRSELDAMLKGSHTEALTGSIPQSGMTLEEYRAERLKKYEYSE